MHQDISSPAGLQQAEGYAVLSWSSLSESHVSMPSLTQHNVTSAENPPQLAALLRGTPSHFHPPQSNWSKRMTEAYFSGWEVKPEDNDKRKRQ